MGKVAALLSMILLSFVSAAGFMFLAGKITSGEMQIAAGQKRFEEGRLTLKDGKSRLEAGRQELSAGKKEYAETEDNLILVLADRLLLGRLYSREARRRIAVGDKQVADGEGKTNVGQVCLDAGELGLLRGREQVRLAKYALVLCALGTVCFASLSIVFGFRWRRSLAGTLMNTDTRPAHRPDGHSRR